MTHTPTYIKASDGNEYLGRHVILDLHDCDAAILADPERIADSLRGAVQAMGATQLFEHFHHFGDGSGVTGFIVLSESHISIHTWPETRYAAVDIFTCGNADPLVGADEIRDLLAAGLEERVRVYRGVKGD